MIESTELARPSPEIVRLLCDVPNPRDGDRLRFRCITCERNPDRPPSPQPIEGLGDSWHTQASIWEVPQGSYPIEFYDRAGVAAVGFLILPFDLRIWQPHLLHDIRAEWNRAFISSRGVSVRAWAPRQGRTLWLDGPDPKPDEEPCQVCNRRPGHAVHRENARGHHYPSGEVGHAFDPPKAATFEIAFADVPW